MSTAAIVCVLLCIALGVASVANHAFVDRQDIDRQIDARMITVFLAAGSLLSFWLAIWFTLAAAARGLA
ncbi:hypothetical protein RFM23_05390 [Mesorhizobium abyssinicae]|uniref:Uncharacterized protein n=1 Tax=Mesorhizobium abyssinicae TaxID=1209958 RepID=A0ABU5AIF6_9HYPH|nr:hypothetical protein [Mesorhizobium abyssinicae]MDX8537056.1 hypothetical protein [Mesorhizobium abyssinicae]